MWLWNILRAIYAKRSKIKVLLLFFFLFSGIFCVLKSVRDCFMLFSFRLFLSPSGLLLIPLYQLLSSLLFFLFPLSVLIKSPLVCLFFNFPLSLYPLPSLPVCYCPFRLGAQTSITLFYLLFLLSFLVQWTPYTLFPDSNPECFISNFSQWLHFCSSFYESVIHFFILFASFKSILPAFVNMTPRFISCY